MVGGYRVLRLEYSGFSCAPPYPPTPSSAPYALVVASCPILVAPNVGQKQALGTGIMVTRLSTPGIIRNFMAIDSMPLISCWCSLSWCYRIPLPSLPLSHPTTHAPSLPLSLSSLPSPPLPFSSYVVKIQEREGFPVVWPPSCNTKNQSTSNTCANRTQKTNRRGNGHDRE